MTDIRQRFFIQNSPVRGEIVHLNTALNTIFAQRHYPLVIQLLLGEMLAGAALLASTLKFKGRLSIQAQSNGILKWAMAECSDTGDISALAQWDESFDFNKIKSSDDLLKTLQGGALFINIEPENGERYQGIIALDADNLAGCLMHYYQQSAQIPTHIKLSADNGIASGLLIQLLPRTEDEIEQDADLWPRITLLANTLKSSELLELQPNETLYRLYHEEEVVLADIEKLQFGCTCSRERCMEALEQVGFDAVQEILSEDGEIKMDCQFCNTAYRFGAKDTLAIFGRHLS